MNDSTRERCRSRTNGVRTRPPKGSRAGFVTADIRAWSHYRGGPAASWIERRPSRSPHARNSAEGSWWVRPSTIVTVREQLRVGGGSQAVGAGLESGLRAAGADWCHCPLDFSSSMRSQPESMPRSPEHGTSTAFLRQLRDVETKRIAPRYLCDPTWAIAICDVARPWWRLSGCAHRYIDGSRPPRRRSSLDPPFRPERRWEGWSRRRLRPRCGWACAACSGGLV